MLRGGSNPLSASGGAFGVTGGPTSGWTFNAAATPGTAETIAIFKVSDDATAKVEVVNASSTNNAFIAEIRGTAPTTNTPLVIRGVVTTDTGSNPAIFVDGRTAAGGALTTRDIITFRNNLTEVVTVKATGLKIGASGTTITQTRVYSQSLDVASVAANTTAEQTFTVTGLSTADKVFVNKPSVNAGLGIVNARVSAADTLALTFVNATAGAIDPAAETYTIFAVRS